MADNFNLRQFLSENKLTKNAKLLKEETSLDGRPVDMRSIEIDGIDTEDYPDFSDAYIAYAEFEDGTPLSEDELMRLEEENYGLVNDLAHESLHEVKEPVMENTLTAKEKRLVEMVQDALGITPQAVAEEAPMAEDEMVEEKPLPKYENIEKLMQEIEHGTNEAAYKHKMAKMKEVAEMLEARVSSLEEGDGADFVDAKKVKQMKKDIMTLRKQAEKLEKEYEKKFAKKQDSKEEK
jgi:hypothetical protein